MDSLWSRLRTPQAERTPLPAAEILANVRILTQAGGVGLGSIEFRLGASAFRPEDLNDVLGAVVDARCLDAWLKASRVNPKILTAELLAKGEAVYATAGLEWLLAKVGPRKNAPLVLQLLRDVSRPAFLPAPALVLAEFLESDLKGAWLEVLLGSLKHGEVPLDRLVGMLKQSPKALALALGHLPGRVCDKALGGMAAQVIQGVFSELPETSGSVRRLGCAQLLRVVADLVSLPKSSVEVQDLLKGLAAVSKALRLTASSAELKAVTWVCERVDEDAPPSSRGTAVNSRGARLLAQTLVSVTSGADAPLALDALVRNVGMTPIGELGEPARFDPKIHEDTGGGLLPGDAVVIRRIGWRFERDTVLRAQVASTH